MMRKLFLLSALISLSGCTESLAQVQRGTTYRGGTVTVRGQAENSRGAFDNSTSRNNQHSISPELQWGKFTNATTMIGLGVRYGFSWGKNSSGSTSSSDPDYSSSRISQSVTLLPFIRKYKPLGERWAVFLHAEVGPTYNWSKGKNKPSNQNPDKNHSWQYELSVKPGVVYFLPKKNLAIEGDANIFSFGAYYTKNSIDSRRDFRFATGLSTDFPSYFTIRIARYLPTKTD